jgi:GNAT superfamily N-acetyltransferase
MKFNTSGMSKTEIKLNPTENDIEEIKNWLKDEDAKFNEGFYCNWNIIWDSFLRKQLICCSINDTPVGFLVWSKGEIYIEIDIMEIRPEYRKKGIGHYFIEKISVHFKDLGFKALKLFCEPRESESFWEKEGFIQFPQRGYSESDLTFYKSLIETLHTCKNNSLNRIELWNFEPHEILNNSPLWQWNIEGFTGKMKLPILHPCNINWNIRWIKNGQIEKDCKVKYFSLEFPVDFEPFMYITKLDND